MFLGLLPGQNLCTKPTPWHMSQTVTEQQVQNTTECSLDREIKCFESHIQRISLLKDYSVSFNL